MINRGQQNKSQDAIDSETYCPSIEKVKKLGKCSSISNNTSSTHFSTIQTASSIIRNLIEQNSQLHQELLKLNQKFQLRVNQLVKEFTAKEQLLQQQIKQFKLISQQPHFKPQPNPLVTLTNKVMTFDFQSQIQSNDRKFLQISNLVESQLNLLNQKKEMFQRHQVQDILSYNSVYLQVPLVDTKNIIRKYQEIIQRYKQYSAYLRSYLCQCINFMGVDNQLQNQMPFDSQLMKIALKSCKQRIAKKIKCLTDQNQELKSILDEMIWRIKNNQ